MRVTVLKNKNLALTLLGKFVSKLGTHFQSFALSLYVLKLTGSGGLFATVLAVAYIPQILLGPFAGVFADRFDRKKMIVALDILSGIVMGIF